MIRDNLEYIELCRDRRMQVRRRDWATERIGEIDERINEIELAELEADDNDTD